jgi:hypothetical protein
MRLQQLHWFDFFWISCQGEIESSVVTPAYSQLPCWCALHVGTVVTLQLQCLYSLHIFQLQCSVQSSCSYRALYNSRDGSVKCPCSCSLQLQLSCRLQSEVSNILQCQVAVLVKSPVAGLVQSQIAVLVQSLVTVLCVFSCTVGEKKVFHCVVGAVFSCSLVKSPVAVLTTVFSCSMIAVSICNVGAVSSAMLFESLIAVLCVSSCNNVRL